MNWIPGQSQPQQSLRVGNIIFHDFKNFVVRETLSPSGIIREWAPVQWADRETADYYPLHTPEPQNPAEPEELERPKISLKFWEGAGELAKLAGVCDQWWNKVQQYLSWITFQIDAETAPLSLVNLLAWQRDVTRIDAETEALYRKRVKYAFANAKDAGSRVGFARIWKRLDLGDLKQQERFNAVEWDVIGLEVSDSLLSEHQEMFNALIRQYGRTCRRYSLATSLDFSAIARSAAFSCKTINSIAKEIE